MAGVKVLHVSSGARTPSANTTSYTGIGGQTQAGTTETLTQVIFRTPGSITDLRVYVSANTIAGTSTFEIRKDTGSGPASGNNIVSVGNSATGEFRDTTNSDSVAAGDKINVRFVPGAATNTLTFQHLSVHFQSNTDGESCARKIMRASTNPAWTTVGTTFNTIEGLPTTAQATEANVETELRHSGTFKNLALNTTTNTATGNITCTLRKNGADSALTISITASTTGWFEDTTNSVSVASGDKVCYEMTVPGGSTGTMTERARAVDYVTTDNWMFYTWAVEGGSGVVDNTTTFVPLAAANIATTEAFHNSRMLQGVDVKEITCYVSANTSSNTSTITIRKQGADGTNIISITADTTGRFSDYTPHTDAFDAATNFNLATEITVPTEAGTNTLTLQTITVNLFNYIRISLSRTYKWNILSRVSLSGTYKWNIIGRISQSSTLKWNIIERISKSSTLKWNILERVSLSRTYPWNIIGRISLSRTYKWNIIGRISLPQTYKWNILQRVSQSSTFKWNIIERMSKSSTLKWNIIGRISQSLTLKWNIIGRVSLSRTYKWNILQRVSLSRTYLWDILAGLERISKSQTYKWNINERVSKSQTYKWNIIERVSKPSTLKWNIIGRISKSSVLKWNILERISKQQTYKWNILQRISLSNTYKWNIIGRISKALTLKWNINQRISKSQSYKWNILQRVSLSRTYLWNITSRVSKSSILKWNIIGRISKSSILKWHIVNRLSKSLTLLWNIEPSANVTNTDLSIILLDWIQRNWVTDPYTQTDAYLIPPKDKITFGTRIDMKAGTHSDMHIHIRSVDENPEFIDTAARLQDNSEIVNLWVDVMYIPRTPPDFNSDSPAPPSRMMWHIRKYIDELIRSNSQQLEDSGIEIISMVQQIPDANTPPDVHAQSNIEPFYTIVFTLKAFYTLEITRLS